MDKVHIYDLELNEKEMIETPQVFNFNPRKDLIRKATEINQCNNKQIQGREKRAGLKNTAQGWGTGHGLSRAPRIKGSGFPTARNVGRVPFAVGGRRTHPIKTERKMEKKMNKKTKMFSLISAISASADASWIKSRGHYINNIPELPLVIDDKIQTIKKTKMLYSILCEMGFKDELERVKNSRKIRPGKGKRRGRKYKKHKGLLIIIKDDFGIKKASQNLPGVDVVNIDKISINHLAPGGHPGRLTLWSHSAFKNLNEYDKVIK